MKTEELKEHINGLIADKNYLSAGLHIVEMQNKDLQKDLLGKTANAIVAELESLPWRQNKERVYYLRSLLAWIMKEIPGLSHLYREQLKHATGHSAISDIIKKTANIPTNPEEAVDAVRDTMEQLKSNIDDTTDAISSSDLKSTGDKFIKQAEKGIIDGLDQFSNFLNSLGSSSSKPKEHDSEKEQ